MSKKDEDYLDNLLKNMGQPSGESSASDGGGKSAMERLGKPAPVMPVKAPEPNTDKAVRTADRNKDTAGSSKEKSGVLPSFSRVFPSLGAFSMSGVRAKKRSSRFFEAEALLSETIIRLHITRAVKLETR